MKVLPSLSTDGFITHGKALLDNLLTYYILTDAAQTYLFHGKLLSLPYTYAKYVNEPEFFAKAVEEDIKYLLDRYFKANDVIVKAYEENNSKTYYYVIINASVIDDDGRKFDLTLVNYIYNGKSKKITKFNNYGLAQDYVLSQIPN